MMTLSAFLSAVNSALTVAAPYVLASIIPLSILALIWRIATPLTKPVDNSETIDLGNGWKMHGDDLFNQNPNDEFSSAGDVSVGNRNPNDN